MRPCGTWDLNLTTGEPVSSSRKAIVISNSRRGNHLDFTIAEYQSRLAKTQAEMAKRGLPVLLLHAPENITCLSGFRMLGFFMYHALIVPAQGEPILVVRDVEQPA